MIESPTRSQRVSHRVGPDHTLPRPDSTDPADADPAVADRVLLDPHKRIPDMGCRRH